AIAMSLTITISSCLSPDSGTTCSLGSSRMPAVNSAYISATLRGVSRRPSRFGSSPMPSRIKRTPWAIRSRLGSLGLRGFRRLDLMSVTFVFIYISINRVVAWVRRRPACLIIWRQPHVHKAGGTPAYPGRSLPLAVLTRVRLPRGFLNFTQSNTGLLCGRAALLEFRHRVYCFIVGTRNFNINWSKSRLNSHRLARESAAPDFIAARANGRRLGKEHLQKLFPLV